MKKVLAFLFVALSSTLALAQQAPPRPIVECAKEVPFGAPVSRPGTATICRSGYITNVDLVAKIPYWTAHTLVPSDATSCLPRDDAFAADQSLPKGQRAEPSDYAKSGYDQGHMVSNADLSFSAESQKESFLMTNMSPQLPGLNRGAWKLLETSTRAWAWGNNTTVTVYAGNIWSANSKTIGANKVVVPDYLFKIVIFHNTRQSIAFIFPNKEGLGTNIGAFQTTVAELERITGNTFQTPDNKGMKNLIPVADFKKVTDDKRALCK
jgi:endonuclease G